MKHHHLRPASLWRWLRRRVTGSVRVRHAVLWLRAWPLRLFRQRLAGRRMGRGEIGRMGELITARWLAFHGRRVLYRNYRGVNRGEVDIVARHGDVLCFIEVKTRTSSLWSPGGCSRYREAAPDSARCSGLAAVTGVPEDQVSF